MKSNMEKNIDMEKEKDKDMDTGSDMEMRMDFQRFGYWILEIGEQFNRYLNTISGPALYSPVLQAPYVFQA
jgi:hypothetical protein